MQLRASRVGQQTLKFLLPSAFLALVASNTAAPDCDSDVRILNPQNGEARAPRIGASGRYMYLTRAGRSRQAYDIGEMLHVVAEWRPACVGTKSARLSHQRAWTIRWARARSSIEMDPQEPSWR